MKSVDADSTWIDIHDENLMVNLGIHCPDYEEPDFSKSPKERKMLKKMKSSCITKLPRNWSTSNGSNYPLTDKIIINLKKNNSYPKTTYSYKISQYQIPNLINKFKSKKGNCIVNYYIWNGHKYSANELPVNPYECVKIYR